MPFEDILDRFDVLFKLTWRPPGIWTASLRRVGRAGEGVALFLFFQVRVRSQAAADLLLDLLGAAPRSFALALLQLLLYDDLIIVVILYSSADLLSFEIGVLDVVEATASKAGLRLRSMASRALKNCSLIVLSCLLAELSVIGGL